MVEAITRHGLARMPAVKSTPWFSSKPKCHLKINNFFFVAVLVPTVILISNVLPKFKSQVRYLLLAAGTLQVVAAAFNVMPSKTKNPLSPKKLLLSKWTAVEPNKKRKHFLVLKLITPPTPDTPTEHVEIEAVYDGWVTIIPWRQLQDSAIWIQGWK